MLLTDICHFIVQFFLFLAVPKRILKVVHRKEKGHKRRKKKKKKKKGKHRKEEVKDIDSISTEVSRSKLIPATTRGYDVHNPVTQEPEKASAGNSSMIDLLKVHQIIWYVMFYAWKNILKPNNLACHVYGDMQ